MCGAVSEQVIQLEASAVVASLLPGLLTYYPVDQFAVAPPLPGEPAVAGLHVEAWAPNKLRAGSPPFAAPRWHLPNEAEVRQIFKEDRSGSALCESSGLRCAIIKKNKRTEGVLLCTRAVG